MRRLALLASLTLLGTSSCPPRAELTPLYADYVFQNGAWCPDLPFAGNSSRSAECRALLFFDLSDVPGRRVVQAELQLDVEYFLDDDADEECFAVVGVSRETMLDQLHYRNSLDAFVDAGDGPLFAEFCLTKLDEGRVKRLWLRHAAVKAIHEAPLLYGRRSLSLAIHSTTINPDLAEDLSEGARFGSGPPATWRNRLVLLSTPERGRGPR